MFCDILATYNCFFSVYQDRQGKKLITGNSVVTCILCVEISFQSLTVLKEIIEFIGDSLNIYLQ